jgi:hypothetical protein
MQSADGGERNSRAEDQPSTTIIVTVDRKLVREVLVKPHQAERTSARPGFASTFHSRSRTRIVPICLISSASTNLPDEFGSRFARGSPRPGADREMRTRATQRGRLRGALANAAV